MQNESGSIKVVVITVVTTIIAGIILLNIEYSYFIPEPNLAQKADQVVKHIEDPPKESSLEKLVEEDIDILTTLYQTASKINVFTTRNEEFVRIISLALEENKPAFAAMVASKIDHFQNRNEQNVKIVDYALSHNQISLALAISEKIDHFRIRNEQYKKIIDFALKLRQKTKNE